MAERLLFVTLTSDVGSDRIVSDLGAHGAACAVLGPPGNYAGLSRFVETRFAMPGVLGTWAATCVFARRLARAIAAFRPDRIVPLDELASLLLRTMARQARTPVSVRDVLVASFGDPDGYHAACHRMPLMRIAAAAGVRTPAFWNADGRPAFPAVVKRDGSSGSGGVTIVPDASTLRAALRQAAAVRIAKRAMARAAGYDHGPDSILVQQYVPGALAMQTVAADRGRVVDGVSFLATASHPETRASTILAPIDSAEMTAAAERIVGAIGCSGFVSFDFIVDADGAAFLIEMNPRPIGSTHLGQAFGHDLAHAFLTGRAAGSDAVPRPAVTSVALFPKELERDPSGAAIDGDAGRRHDVPWTEPRLVQAYASHLKRLHPSQAEAIDRRLGHAAPADRRGVLVGARLSDA